MCGICGIVNFNTGGTIEKETLRQMCAKMFHRGPDDEGIYISRESMLSIGLGHRRLKIIDLSAAGRQPMSNEDGSIWIVFNGEIYNYKELRSDLEYRGHKFSSDTDTETVIHLYEEYRKDCLRSLRGMFAFAIWDKNTQSILLARDRVGKKPLIYAYSDGVFCFASEFSALLSGNFVKKEINHAAIPYYLTLGYIPAPLTIYKDIFKLPPAHRLILKDKRVTLEQYWELDYSKKKDISEADAAAEVLKLLKEAVKVRLHSDVPLGVFLSGGIDSSAVVALMSEVSPEKIKTFSIGFEEKNYNELKYAFNIARRFNTEHNEFVVRPNALEVLPLLVERYGEPYADSSCIPTYYVSQQTRKYVTVALNGDGGDESFAGYERYAAMLAAEVIWKFPHAVRGIIRLFSKAIPDSVNSKNKIRRIKRFLDGAFLPAYQRYLKWVGIFDRDFQKKMYSPGYSNSMPEFESCGFLRNFLNGPVKLDMLDRLLNADVHTYLPGDLLVKTDITSMANSLEVRSPFLDQKVMEFSAMLPAGYKIKNFTKKYILKKALSSLVPKENIYRGKMGFGVPVGRWFRCELKSFVKESLLSPVSLKRGYFNPEIVRNIVNEHIEGKKDYAFQIWSLLMLELWHQRFID